MGQDVGSGTLAEVVAGHRSAYLVTVGEDARPHVVAVSPRVTADTVVVDEVGRHSRRNMTARPAVTLLWPPERPDGYSLVVDGTATVTDGTTVVLQPTRAVQHRPHERPAGGTSPTGCGSDCLPVDLPAGMP